MLIGQSKILPALQPARSKRLEQYKVMAFNTKHLQNDIYVAGVKLFNNLPREIKAIKNLETFKSSLKRHLLTKTQQLLSNNHREARDFN